MTEGEAPVVAGRAPSPVSGTRLLGAAAALVAAVLAVVGSFLPLVSGELRYPNEAVLTFSVTGWKITSGSPGMLLRGVAQNGIPLTVAAALLAIAVLVVLVAAQRAAPPVVRSGAVAGCAVAAAFLIGVLATVSVQVADFVGTLGPAANPDVTVRETLGTGFWLEVLAGVLALAAVALTAWPARETGFRAPPGDGPRR